MIDDIQSSVSLLTSCQVILLIIKREMLNYPTIVVDLSIFPFSSFSFCFMYFEVLLLGEYTFWIIKLSLWIQLFIIILYPSISMIILLVKMSTLSDINIVNPAFLLICVSMVYLFHLLIFNLFVFLILLFFIFI